MNECKESFLKYLVISSAVEKGGERGEGRGERGEGRGERGEGRGERAVSARRT